MISFDTAIAFLNDYFRPILLLLSSAFAVYFAYKKIGNKVSAQFSIGSSSFTPMHIREIVLSNKKDKPVNIYAVHAVFHNDLWLELERFSPPKVLRAYESISLSMSPYSCLSVGSDEYDPDFTNANIYIESDEKVIECESRYRSDFLHKYSKISIKRCSYNGFIYDETVSFILVYILDGSLKTAFIHKSGYIGNEWEFTPNHLGEDATALNILSMIKSYKFDSIFNSYSIYKVESLGNVKAVKA
ncbi:hypothetical protein [Gallaecimonas pentaromativorans]|uniref:Uncharacterized protein n=1 Tax=Gallaecimonas pentaromativorans TaxID=584787 RepID=A0A3N1PA02_9GAMM|nr:hypothetical protein [Gallaecimonas pentaromativorans]ROQ24859.1 hypothetical protein EDC28_106106 [Gallaecimonas pentaromativorans]